MLPVCKHALRPPERQRLWRPAAATAHHHTAACPRPRRPSPHSAGSQQHCSFGIVAAQQVRTCVSYAPCLLSLLTSEPEQHVLDLMHPTYSAEHMHSLADRRWVCFRRCRLPCHVLEPLVHISAPVAKPFAALWPGPSPPIGLSHLLSQGPLHSRRVGVTCSSVRWGAAVRWKRLNMRHHSCSALARAFANSSMAVRCS